MDHNSLHNKLIYTFNLMQNNGMMKHSSTGV